MEPRMARFVSMDNSYVRQLPEFCVVSQPMSVSQPRLLQFNDSLADELGWSESDANRLGRIFSGQEMLPEMQPVAQAYAGHQFGNFVPQLGDGRALLLGEVIDVNGQRRDIALKGSGPTAFSRGGDGKAAVGPVLREYLVGEAMHALGIPTTRALAAVATGDSVMRMNRLPGAMLTRVAASHIRIGTFQYFAARGRFDLVRKLADYTIHRHDSELVEHPNRYLLLLQNVIQRQAALVAKWMLAGFIHGVMNTDNMTISGETIDYGPCAFMESYHPGTVFSSIDTGGRYAYGNQPAIAHWNLARFAETLLPLINEEDPQSAIEPATAELEKFGQLYQQHWLGGALTKLGLSPELVRQDDQVEALVIDWFDLLERNQVDLTLAWRRLADAVGGNEAKLSALFHSKEEVDPWLQRWRRWLPDSPLTEIAEQMRNVNPVYIARNHLVEEALTAASDQADLGPFCELLDRVRNPFVEQPDQQRFAEPASNEFNRCYRTFCGT
ncbi:MAG: YdiU family protein [Planctomycetales bacterium]|nr:YdiU family protein [Planctomycetales bacterium]